MSATVISRGFVAVLDTPLDSESREDLNERLHENKSNLQINYEGTLVYSDTVPRKDSEEIYGLVLGEKQPQIGGNGFMNDCASAGIVINGTWGVKPYQEIWYNGGDSRMNMLTLEAFLKA